MKERSDLERDARAAYKAKGEEFSAVAVLGHRYPEDMLPEELQDCYLAWQLTGGNMADYFHVIHTYTILEIQEAIALQRTTIYLSEED